MNTDSTIVGQIPIGKLTIEFLQDGKVIDSQTTEHPLTTVGKNSILNVTFDPERNASEDVYIPLILREEEDM